VPGRSEERPLVDPAAGPPVTTYAGYLAADNPYDSGDFLVKPVNLVRPRFVPDMVRSDPDLARKDREIRDLLAARFGPRDGLPYERYIERQHRPDDADLDFCRSHGFFRMTIAKELGGEGRPKVDYYLLAKNTQAMVDVGISLSVQVNTGLGTTPVFLARYKDLPKAQKEVGHFVSAAVEQRVTAMLETLARNPTPRGVEGVQKVVDERVASVASLKGPAGRFLKAWKRAAEAVNQAAEPAAAQARVAEAAAAWKQFCQTAAELYGELGRRVEACDLFLRWVSQGQISAFALTEPSAGSDTARVATRAKLRSVPVDAEPDGVLTFVAADGTERRFLLDARRLEFRDGQALYRWSESSESSPVRFDEYDYETDDPRRTRWYDHGGRRIPFSDIAQLRERDGRTYYDYWELTGAKMWITNGRMMGIMCLYAKTDEGVTGFVVDRHAEGLTVGKDEDKLGQCGSPTNELALQSVRVPRENVLGLEGRGQVNALETLNVGRAGLGMSAMAQMEALIAWSRAFVLRTYGEIPDWAAWRLRRMEEIRFTSEALAYEVIGRFEHPQTKSVRLESAVAKMLVSELLHQVIELAEDVHGLDGQTQHHLVEKRKRDARVLTIYEGTNEIQRFFILRDLASEVAPRWAQTPEPPAHLGREALELEVLKGALRQRVQSALEVFGAGLAQNPNLQANCFLLAEAAAWLKAADSTLARLAWLGRLALANDQAEGPPEADLGRGALTRCYGEVRRRLQRFDEELTHLRRGYYAPEVRAANLVFDRPAEAERVTLPASRIERPVRVLVVLDAPVADVPQPQVLAGRLLEPYRVLGDADRAALEAALRLKDAAPERVTVQAVAVAPQTAVSVLREVLSLGVDRVRLVAADSESVAPDSAAAALAAVWEADSRPDVVLGGAGEAGGLEGLAARLAAEALGVPFAGTAAHVAIEAGPADATIYLADADGRGGRSRALPAAAGLRAGSALRPFTIAGYLAGLARPVDVVPWPRKAPARRELFVEASSANGRPAVDESARPLSAAEAARRVIADLGLSGAAGVSEPYDGPIEDVGHPSLLEEPPAGALAVLAADADGRIANGAAATVRAARLAAAAWGGEAKVMLLVAAHEQSQRRALSALRELGAADVVLLATSGADSPADVRARLLAECWPQLNGPPRAVVGEPWTEGALAALVCRKGLPGALSLRCRGLSRRDGTLIVRAARAGGRLPVEDVLPPPAAAAALPAYWIGLTADPEIADPDVPAPGPLRVQRWSPRLERFYAQNDIQALLEELKRETGLIRLPDADFIVDVGFGVGNRDGFEAVIEPLVHALRNLGVRGLVVGGSRKVTEELHLLPADRQIGQSGVSVNPNILLAVGVSGAPQHLNYIGPRATVLAFNRDPEAPIMTLNQRQPRPRVFPVVGDLFLTVPAFTAALGEDGSPRTQQPAAAGAAGR
jgi:alkylation response protein AidB-like acyl-CoA dehydrogenase/electron transfer flavoprotein alpha subunit